MSSALLLEGQCTVSTKKENFIYYTNIPTFMLTFTSGFVSSNYEVKEVVGCITDLMFNKTLMQQHCFSCFFLILLSWECWAYSSWWCGGRNQCSKVTVRVIYPALTWSVAVINHRVLISDASLLWLRNVHVIQFGTYCWFKNITLRFPQCLYTVRVDHVDQEHYTWWSANEQKCSW